MIIKFIDRFVRSPLWVHVTIERLHNSRPYHGPYTITRDEKGELRRDATGTWDPVILPHPWYFLIAFRVVRLGVHAPTTGYGLCIYTRWGWCRWDLVFDRRGYWRALVQA